METSNNGWPALKNAPSYKLQWINGNVLEGDVATLFEYLCAQFNTRVEIIKKGDTCGWCYRNTTGSNPPKLSNHSSGTAVDLNATSHRRGEENTFSSAQVNQIRAILSELGGVIRWGGDYKDEMHFEIIANAAKVAEAAKRLQKGATLRRGDKGDRVSALQNGLNNKFPSFPNDAKVYGGNGAKLAVDGSFGPQVEAWVKTFQKHSGLTVDGVAGPKTQEALAKIGITV